LTDLQLGAKQLALSILGFNLGIELMQLFVIALVAPWLILLSLTPTYSWARASCAALAMIAALGWIAERITGDENVIGMALQQAPRYAPIGILILALLALLALGVKHSYDQTISNSS
jgi:polyferredoxin